jgi:predicted metalloprotease with PDZ domain
LLRAAPEDAAPTTATTTTNAPTALSTADFEETASPPPGCSRYTVNIKKPLGLVLEQDTKTLVLRVAELSPDGAAQRAGVGIGDQLIAVSGVVYDRTEEYGEVQVRKGQQRVRLSARGETLKTIGAAITSHPGAWDVTLEFQRCGDAGGNAGGAN